MCTTTQQLYPASEMFLSETGGIFFPKQGLLSIGYYFKKKDAIQQQIFISELQMVISKLAEYV